MNVTLTPIGGANRLTQVAAQPKSAIRNWRRLLDSHDRLARQTVERHRSNLIKNTADGILAAVDRRGRAIRCALAFSAAAGQIGLPLRSGLHTGEIEVRGRDIGDIAVSHSLPVSLNEEVSCCRTERFKRPIWPRAQSRAIEMLDEITQSSSAKSSPMLSASDSSDKYFVTIGQE